MHPYNISTSTTTFIRTDFTVGIITEEEEISIIKDIKKFMISTPQFGGITVASLVNFKTFSIFYSSTNDREEINKLFFKLKLRFPEFVIRTHETTYSIRS